jgi:hypothetical protein
MPQSLNRIELIGRLGADPQIFSSQADFRVCTCWLVTEDLPSPTPSVSPLRDMGTPR